MSQYTAQQRLNAGQGLHLQYIKPARAKPQLFFIELTDTFAGEANYSWVTRSIVRAKSARGAACILSRESGLNFKYVGCERYDSASGATCAFIREYDSATDADYLRLARDDRKAG